MNMKHLVTAALVLMSASTLLAIDTTVVTDSNKQFLFSNAEIVQSQHGFEALRGNENALDFRAVQSSNDKIGFTDEQYWVRFALHNPFAEKRQYYLETARPITDEVELYAVNGSGELTIYESGDQMPFKERPLDHRASIFKVTLEAHSTSDFYLRLKSDGEVINLPLTLYKSEGLVQSTYQSQLFNGTFYGIILLAATIYLIFYFGISEISFLNYGFYVLSIGLLQASLDGYIFQYFLPQGGWLNSHMVMISASLSIFFLGRYSETFLHLSRHSRWLPWVFRGIYSFVGIMFIGMLFSPAWLKMSYPLVNMAGLVLLLFIVASVIILQLRKIPVDPFFSIGIGFLVMGFVIFILNNLSILPNTFLTENSSKFGSGLEVIFLSISMTNRIRRLKSEKERSQAQALRKSEEMNDIKNYFMSNMSHELRTPLNAILGLADQLIKQPEGKENLKGNMEIIKFSSLSLLSSVNDILDFSKIEKGELKLQLAPFNPAQTLYEISENWKIQAQEKDLHYIMEVKDDLPRLCMGDADRLAQIANNLLSNAVKFTPNGAITFTVKCKNDGDALNTIVLMVSDTGVGIPPEKQETVFESFLQENINDKRNFGGLGLGLSIVKHLIELHGGQISMNSKVGVGTECTVEIPYQVLEQPKPKTRYSVESLNLHNANILVAEDNALNQMVMRKILSGWKNTEFTIVENGQEALDALSEAAYDLVLMDLQMPVMDGYEATEKIRAGAAQLSKEDIPIIAVTADTMEKTKEKVFALGMNDYMAKPIKGEALFGKIASALEARTQV